jgi:hypothetical protein
MALSLCDTKSDECHEVVLVPATRERQLVESKIRDVVFVHLPKTGGTSMRNMLVEAMPRSQKVFDYGAETFRLEGNFIDVNAENIRNQKGIFDLRSRLARDQAVLVCTHVSANPYLGSFHPASIVTFLRDPVERVISGYQYHVRHREFRGTLAEFYEAPENINVQCRMLWGIDLRDVGFIGLFEAMADMVRALARHLGIDLKMRQDNVADRVDRLAVDNATRARILALNQDDRRLYDHVAANIDYFTDYRGRRTAWPMPGRGKVYRARDGSFKGWASPHDPGQLAQVEVRVGGEVVRRVYADQFVPWLKTVVPHSVGGFMTNLPAKLLATGEPIRFMIAGTEKDLIGSPMGAMQ